MFMKVAYVGIKYHKSLTSFPSPLNEELEPPIPPPATKKVTTFCLAPQTDPTLQQSTYSARRISSWISSLSTHSCDRF